MKILFYIRHYFDTWGGIEENVSNISEYLKKSNDIAITSGRIDFSHRKYDKEIKYLKHSNVSVSDYDVIFVENFEILPHFLLCAKIIINNVFKKNKHVKVILVPHGGFTLDWKMFHLLKRVPKYLYNKIFGLWFINNFCDLVVAVSEWEKKELIKEGIKNKIEVIRNGYNHLPDNSNIVNSKKEDYFVFIGRIDPIKNLEEIILVFADLVKNQNFKNHKLIIIGDFDKNPIYVAKLKKIIIEKSLNEKVEFVGPKYNEEKYRLISGAKCLFCLSHVENDPVVIKEAFSVGTKVLIKDKFGLHDFIGENNVFVKLGKNIDMVRFAEFINADFNNNLLIPVYSWEKVAKKYEEIL